MSYNFRQFWVKEAHLSETISDEKRHLYCATRRVPLGFDALPDSDIHIKGGQTYYTLLRWSYTCTIKTCGILVHTGT